MGTHFAMNNRRLNHWFSSRHRLSRSHLRHVRSREIKGTNLTNSLNTWIYFGILRSEFAERVTRWHLNKPELFQRTSSGELNNMFLWAKACRSISKPLAMLRLELESAWSRRVVFFGEWAHVSVCLSVSVCVQAADEWRTCTRHVCVLLPSFWSSSGEFLNILQVWLWNMSR